MEEPKKDFEEITEQLKNYVKLQIELFKLKAVEKGVMFLASLVNSALIFLVVFFILLFGFMALGFYLGNLTGNNAIGFGLLTLFLLIIGIIIFLTKKKYIVTPIQNKAIETIFKNW